MLPVRCPRNAATAREAERLGASAVDLFSRLNPQEAREVWAYIIWRTMSEVWAVQDVAAHQIDVKWS